jgi:hypothetical protein
VSQIVALSIRRVAVHQADRWIATKPQMLGNDDLQALAHRLAEPDTATDLLRFAASQRIIFNDLIQHMYTDDGHGDGRMTRQGLVTLQPLSSPVLLAGGPASLVLVGSRREVIAEHERMLRQAEAEIAQPLYQLDWKTSVSRLPDWQTSMLGQLHFLPLHLMMPSHRSGKWAAEVYLAERDGILAAIALEAYRREHGSYPDSLGALSPALLPKVPIDRLNGEPLRYRVIDGVAVVYSTGADGDDDGGRSPRGFDGEIQNLSAPAGIWGSNRVKDGDWILHPSPWLNR